MLPSPTRSSVSSLLTVVNTLWQTPQFKAFVASPISEHYYQSLFHLIGNWETEQLNNFPQVINPRKIICAATHPSPFIMPLWIPATATFHSGPTTAVFHLSLLQKTIILLNHTMPISSTLPKDFFHHHQSYFIEMFKKNSIQCNEDARR